MKHYTILMLRSQDIISDSRVIRYEQWFQKNQVSYRIIGWDRTGRNIERPNTIYYRGRAGFQQRIKAILNRLKWNCFLLHYLFLHRNEYTIIHACDFDTVLPALVFKMIGKKVVFDIFDWFSDEVKTGKVFIDKTINVLEKWAVKQADLTIICEEERLHQMNSLPSKYIVISNIPTFDCFSIVHNEKTEMGHQIRVAYVGGIVKDRGLNELIDSVCDFPKIQLVIAGYGDNEIIKKIDQAAKRYPNIHFYGKVSYDKAIEIMEQADLLYAMYYKTNLNHIYAAPNKFYEAIFLGKPIITTAGTLVGHKVEKNGNGFVLEEGTAVLRQFFQQVSYVAIKNKQEKIDRLSNLYRYKLDEQMNMYKSIVLQWPNYK